MSSSKNLEFEKTSFLNKSNSAFIEQMYLKFINKDPELPESWANYFEGIGEEIKVIASEINGPSWGPSKVKIDIDELQKKIEIEDNNKVNNEKIDSSLIRFEEHEPFYKTMKNEKDRNTAKMFYIMEYKGDRYRVEIRFKGNHAKGTSPQFMAYSLK